MQYAIYRNVEYGTESVFEVCDFMENMDDHVRVSEAVEIEFPMISNDSVVKKQVEALNNLKKEVQAECEVKLQTIDNKIGELLALTHDGDSNE